MAGEGNLYGKMQPQGSWGGQALQVATNAYNQHEKQATLLRNQEIKAKKDWDDKISKITKDSFKNIYRPEDMDALRTREFSKMYTETAADITDYNIALKNGKMSEADYYTNVYKAQNVARTLDSYAKANEKVAVALEAGDDVLNSAYKKQFFQKEYDNDIKIEKNEDGYTDVMYPIRDADGKVTGHEATPMSTVEGKFNSFQAAPKMHDNPLQYVDEFSTAFKTTNVTTGKEGEKHQRSGVFSAQDVASYTANFNERFNVNSLEVVKKAMIDNDLRDTAIDDVPEDMKQEALDEMLEYGLNKLGGTSVDTTPKPSSTRSEDAKNIKEQDRANLYKTIGVNLDKALLNDPEALAFMMQKGVYDGNPVKESHVDTDGTLYITTSLGGGNEKLYKIDPQFVRNQLLAIKNAALGLSKSVSEDNLIGRGADGELTDYRFKTSVEADAIDKAIASAEDEASPMFGSSSPRQREAGQKAFTEELGLESNTVEFVGTPNKDLKIRVFKNAGSNDFKEFDMVGENGKAAFKTFIKTKMSDKKIGEDSRTNRTTVTEKNKSVATKTVTTKNSKTTKPQGSDFNQ